MSFSGGDLVWVIVIIVVLPVAIIAAAELDERLRQRESPFRHAVLIVRTWALPFFAIWALVVPVIGADEESVGSRFAASGLVLAVGAAALSVLRVVVARVRDRPREAGRRSVPQLLLALPRLGAILVTGWILIDTVWGVDLSAALTALGVTSLVLSFALQDTLSGLASGILLLSDPPFRTGEWIHAGEVEGVVIDVNWRTTRIRDRNGDTITVPNSQLAGSQIVNHSSPEPLHRVVVSLQVAYLNPPTLAKAMLLDAARSTPGVLAEPPPNVVVTQIDDPLMGYDVQMWVDDYAIAPRVRSDFGALVWYQSHRHEVPLPSPAQDLYLYDGVKAGEAEVLTPGEIRQRLQRSPILASLSDADLDRLGQSGRPERFSTGELMVDSRGDGRGLLVIVEGRAQLILADETGDETVIGELAVGEIVGLLGGKPPEGGDLAARAVTDCEVLVIDADVIGGIGSRNADLAAAFNRMSSMRRRRVERIVTSRLVGDASKDAGT